MTLLHMIVMTMSMFMPSSDASFRQALPPSQCEVDKVLAGSFASSTEECDAELVMVSWNIERGVKHSQILEALRGRLAADFYLFQETDLYTRRAGYRNVAEDIARALKMNYAVGIEFEELAQGRGGAPAFQGQAVLSRYPILRSRVLRFRHQLHNWGPRWKARWSWLQPRRGGRMALITEVQCGRQTLVFYNAHLESKADDVGRREQIREILADIRTHYPADTPVIVAGDLNTTKGSKSPVLRELRAEGFHDVLEGHTGSVRTKVHAEQRLDWILVRHLHFSDAHVPKLAISDHFPLMVRVAAGAEAPRSSKPAPINP